jgi:tetratricopeptide (TPR) repeat protein
MGGIGKTELAFYVAERLRDTYPDAQLVVDMRGTDERPRDPHASRRALPDSVRECSVLYLKGGDDIKNGIALFDVERRNIEAGQKWACRHASGDEAAARLCNEYPTAGVYVLALRLHPREFISWLEAALVAARQLKDRDSEGRHSGNLGIVYRTLGAPRRAVEFYEQQLIIAREIGDRSGEGNALFNIGLAVNKLGDNAKAIAHVEGALEIFEQIESPHVERARAVLAQWRGEA